MKRILVILLCLGETAFAQQWQAEGMVGVSGYNGDLSTKNISLKTLGPSVSMNLKYVMPNRYIVFRAGIAYGRIGANDKNNKSPVLKNRNLSFKSHILEGSAGVELNLLDPSYFTGYPYIFVGVGLFHFDPYTFDNDHRKTFLRSLGTEGQGLPEYPDRQMYSLTQFCLPLGVGWKFAFNDKYQVIYEVGARYLLTDYLDDVSKTYVDPQVLGPERGQIAVELANRRSNANTQPLIGLRRGNSNKKDWYYMTGFKVLINLNAEK